MAKGFPGGSDGEESACNVGDLGLIPGLERFPEEGNGNPLVFLPGEFHAQRSLESYIQSMGSQSGKGLSDYHKYTHTQRWPRRRVDEGEFPEMQSQGCG